MKPIRDITGTTNNTGTWGDAHGNTSEEDTAIPVDSPQSLENVVKERGDRGGGRMIVPRITKEEEEDDEREADNREVDPETPTPSELSGEDCWRKEYGSNTETRHQNALILGAVIWSSPAYNTSEAVDAAFLIRDKWITKWEGVGNDDEAETCHTAPSHTAQRTSGNEEGHVERPATACTGKQEQEGGEQHGTCWLSISDDIGNRTCPPPPLRPNTQLNKGNASNSETMGTAATATWDQGIKLLHGYGQQR
ncbi:MAG: hypothetical protein Q9228_003194 [Teloschistes exilis]